MPALKIGSMRTFLLTILVASAASVPTQREFWPRLPEAKPGQWRYRHLEQPQPLDAYRAADPKRGTSKRKVIYVWPALTRPMREPDRIGKLAELLRAYFGREVRVMEPAALPRKAYDPKRRRFSIRRCIPALVKRLPDDALFLLAITDRDMHLPGTRYTFGWGSMKLRVGMCSTWRVDYGKTDELARARFFGLSLHEATHMLSVPHCTERQCLMNGAMDLRESDTRPLLLCWECRDKVCWNLGLDPLERYDALTNAWRSAGLPKVAARAKLAKKVTIEARKRPSK